MKLQDLSKAYKIRPYHECGVRNISSLFALFTTTTYFTTGLLMDDKRSACFINHFFANLTKDYPKVGKELLELHCTENLLRITVDDVQQEMQKINVIKAPGPNDTLLKISKTFAN